MAYFKNRDTQASGESVSVLDETAGMTTARLMRMTVTPDGEGEQAVGIGPAGVIRADPAVRLGFQPVEYHSPV